MTTGLNLTRDPRKAKQVIEAGRLLKQLVTTCKRIHGPNHGSTKKTESKLQVFNARYVLVRYQNGWKFFQALRYEGDGKKCIVQGPITKPRNIETERTITVATEDILPALGTPVVCHGLESAPHINGKIGYLQSEDEETGCYEVYFEDKGLAPCSVRRKNIRVLFELPHELTCTNNLPSNLES